MRFKCRLSWILIHMVLIGCGSKNVSKSGETSMRVPPADTDAWNIAEGEQSGKPSFIRYRPGLKKHLGAPRYPKRLTITWQFEESDSSGMPSGRQSDQMKEFEDAVVGALEPDGLAILAFVFTNSGTREWHFYVEDVDKAGPRMNAALTDFPKLPIILQVQDDPEWDELRQVLARCK